MYLCVRGHVFVCWGIDFASFYDLFRHCAIFFFHFILCIKFKIVTQCSLQPVFEGWCLTMLVQN